MRRLSISLFIAAAVVMVAVPPTIANAGSWNTFRSKALGFAVKYPTGWHAVSSSQLAVRQVVISRQSAQPLAVNVYVYHLRSGHSVSQTLHSFLQAEKRSGNAAYAHVKWTATTIGSRPAMAGIMKLATEGGVPLSYGVYVSAWKAHIYAIMVSVYRNPAPKSIGQIPAIYGQILRTWKFI